mmetsp:Transcript_39013/g.93591  ORF Transcript_39013/g.93591 Transcript_39013/m.93591 type:complete len:220 (-) Transcript_39013:606-1265(-)
MKEESGVGRPAAGLRVELDREPRPPAVDDALITPIIRVDHQRHPVCGQRVAVHGKAMVLRRDVATGGAKVHARLVHATIAKPHLVRLRAGGQGEDLIAEADAKDRGCCPTLHHCADVLDGRCALCWITGAIAEEEAVECVLSEVIVPRYDSHLYAEHIHQVANDVVLDSAVNGKNMDCVTRCHFGIHLVRLGSQLRVRAILIHWRWQKYFRRTTGDFCR